MSATNASDREGILQKFNISQVPGRGRISAAGKIVKLQLLNLSCDKYHVHTSSNVALAVLRGIERTSLRHQRTKAFVQIVRGQLLLLHDYHLSTYQTRGKYPYSKVLVRLLIRYVKLEYDVLYQQENYSPKYEKEVEGKVLRLLHLLVNGIASKFSDDPYDNVASECVLRILNLTEAEYKTSGRFVSALINKLANKIGLLLVKTENYKFNAPCPTILRSSDEITNISDCESDDEDNMLAPYPRTCLSPIAPELKSEPSVKAEPPPDLDSGQGLERLNIDDEPQEQHQPIAGTSFGTCEWRKEEFGTTTGDGTNCSSAGDSVVIDLITEPVVEIRDVHTKQTLVEKRDKNKNDSTDKSTNEDHSEPVVICEAPAVIGDSSSGSGARKVASVRTSPIHTIDLDDDDDVVILDDVSDDDCVIMEENRHENEDEILEKFNDEPKNIKKRAAQVNEISSTTGASGLIFSNLLCPDSTPSTSKSKVFLEVDALRELPIVRENSPIQLRQKILETYANILDKKMKVACLETQENAENLLDEAPNTDEVLFVNQNIAGESITREEVDVMVETAAKAVPNSSEYLQSKEGIQPSGDKEENSDSTSSNINRDNNDEIKQPETPKEISLENIVDLVDEQPARSESTPEEIEEIETTKQLPNVEESKETKEEEASSFTNDIPKQNELLEEFKDQETTPITTEIRSMTSKKSKTEETAASSHHYEENADVAATKLEEILASYGKDERSDSIEVQPRNSVECLKTVSSEFEQMLDSGTNEKQSEQLGKNGEENVENGQHELEDSTNKLHEVDGEIDAAICQKNIGDIENAESAPVDSSALSESTQNINNAESSDVEEVKILSETHEDIVNIDLEKTSEQLSEYEDIFIILPTEENDDGNSTLGVREDDDGDNFVYIWNDNDSNDIEEAENPLEYTEKGICDDTSKTNEENKTETRDEVDQFGDSEIPTNTWTDCSQFQCTEADLTGGVEVQAATPTHDFAGECNEETVQTHDVNFIHEEVIVHDEIECEMREIANSSDGLQEIKLNYEDIEAKSPGTATQLELVKDVTDKNDFIDDQNEIPGLKRNEIETAIKLGDELGNFEVAEEIEENCSIIDRSSSNLDLKGNETENSIMEQGDETSDLKVSEEIEDIRGETDENCLVINLEKPSNNLDLKENEIENSIVEQANEMDNLKASGEIKGIGGETDENCLVTNLQKSSDKLDLKENEIEDSIIKQADEMDNLKVSAEIVEIGGETDENSVAINLQKPSNLDLKENEIENSIIKQGDEMGNLRVSAEIVEMGGETDENSVAINLQKPSNLDLKENEIENSIIKQGDEMGNLRVSAGIEEISGQTDENCLVTNLQKPSNNLDVKDNEIENSIVKQADEMGNLRVSAEIEEIIGETDENCLVTNLQKPSSNLDFKDNEIENSIIKQADETGALDVSGEIEEVEGESDENCVVINLQRFSNNMDREEIASSPDRIDQMETPPTQLAEDPSDKTGFVEEQIENRQLDRNTNDNSSINSQGQLEDEGKLEIAAEFEEIQNKTGEKNESTEDVSQYTERKLEIAAEFDEIQNKIDKNGSMIDVGDGDLQGQPASNRVQCDTDPVTMADAINDEIEEKHEDDIGENINEGIDQIQSLIDEDLQQDYDPYKIEVNSPKIIRDGAQLEDAEFDDVADRNGFLDEMKTSRDDSPDQSYLDQDQTQSGDSFEDAYVEESTARGARRIVPPHLRGIITDDIMECLTINLEMLATTAAARESLKIKDSKPKRRSRLKMSTRRCKKQAKPSEVCADVPSQPPNPVYTTTAQSELCAGSEDSYDSFAGNLIIVEDAKSSPSQFESSIFDDDTLDECIVPVKTSSNGSEPPNFGISLDDCVTFQDLYAKGFTRGEFERSPKDYTAEMLATKSDIDELMFSHDGEILNIFGISTNPTDGKQSPAEPLDPFSEYEESNDSPARQPIIRTKAELKSYDKKKLPKKIGTTRKCKTIPIPYVKLARDIVIEELINAMNLNATPITLRGRKPPTLTNDKSKDVPPQRRPSFLAEKQTQIDECPFENRKITRSLSVDLATFDHLDPIDAVQILPAKTAEHPRNKIGNANKRLTRAGRKKGRSREADTYGSELACSEAITKRRSSRESSLYSRVEAVEMQDIESKLSAVGTTIEQINVKQNRKRIGQNQTRNLLKSVPKRINTIVESLQFGRESVVHSGVEIIPVDSGKSRDNLKKQYRKQRSPRKVSAKGVGKRKRSAPDNAEKVINDTIKKSKLSPEYKEFSLYPEKNISGYKIPKKTQVEIPPGTDVLFLTADESTVVTPKDYLIDQENKKENIDDTAVYNIPVVQLSTRSEKYDSVELPIESSEQDILVDTTKRQNVTEDATSPINSENVINVNITLPMESGDENIQQNVGNVSESPTRNIRKGIKRSTKSLKEPKHKNIQQRIDNFSELSTEKVKEDIKSLTKSLKESKDENIQQNNDNLSELSRESLKEVVKSPTKSLKEPKDEKIDNFSELSRESLKEVIKSPTKSLKESKDENIDNLSRENRKDSKSPAKLPKEPKCKDIPQDIKECIKSSTELLEAPKDISIQQNVDNISELSRKNLTEHIKSSPRSLKELKEKNIQQNIDNSSELSRGNLKKGLKGSTKSLKESKGKDIQQNSKDGINSAVKSLKEPKDKNIHQNIDDNISELSKECFNEGIKSSTKSLKEHKDKNIQQNIDNFSESSRGDLEEGQKSLTKSLKEPKGKGIQQNLEEGTESATKLLKGPKDKNIPLNIDDNISELSRKDLEGDIKSSTTSLKELNEPNMNNSSELSIENRKEDINASTKMLDDKNIRHSSELSTENRKDAKKVLTNLLRESKDKNIENSLELSTDNLEEGLEDSTDLLVDPIDKSIKQNIDDTSGLSIENHKDSMENTTRLIELKVNSIQQDIELSTENIKEDSTKSTVEIDDERLLSEIRQNTKEGINLTIQKSPTESEIGGSIVDTSKFLKANEVKDVHTNSQEDITNSTSTSKSLEADEVKNVHSDLTKTQRETDDQNLCSNYSKKTDFSVLSLIASEAVFENSVAKIQQRLNDERLMEITREQTGKADGSTLLPKEALTTQEEENTKCSIANKDIVETMPGISSEELKDTSNHSIGENIPTKDDPPVMELNTNLLLQKAEIANDNTAEITNKFRGVQIPPDKKQKLLNRIRNIIATDDKIESDETQEILPPKVDAISSQESSREKLFENKGISEPKAGKNDRRRSERNIFRDVESLAISECRSKIVADTQISKEGHEISPIRESRADEATPNLDQNSSDEKEEVLGEEHKIRESSPDIICLDDVETSKRYRRRKSIIKTKDQSPRGEKKYVTFNMEKNGYRTYDPEREPDTFITSRHLFVQEKLYNYAKRPESHKTKLTTKKDGVNQQQPRILNLEQFPKDSELCKDMKSLFPSENKPKRKLDEIKAHSSKRKCLGKDIRSIVDKLAARPKASDQLKTEEDNEKIEITIIGVIDEEANATQSSSTELIEKKPSKEETNVEIDQPEILLKSKESINIEAAAEFSKKILEVEGKISTTESAENTGNESEYNVASVTKDVPDFDVTVVREEVTQTENICKHNVTPTLSSFGTAIKPALKNPELVVVLERMNIDPALFPNFSKDAEKEVDILSSSNKTNIDQNSKAGQDDNLIVTIQEKTNQVSELSSSKEDNDVSTWTPFAEASIQETAGASENNHLDSGTSFTEINIKENVTEQKSQVQISTEFKKVENQNVWSSFTEANIEETVDATNKSPQRPSTPEFKTAENENTWRSLTATKIHSQDPITPDFKESGSEDVVEDSFASVKEETVETPFDDTNDAQPQTVDLSNVSSDSGNDISNILPSDLSWSGDSFLLNENFEQEEITADVPIKTEVLETSDGKDDNEKIDDVGLETATDHSYSMGGPLVCGELLVDDDITEQLDNSLIANDNKFPLSKHDRILLTQTNLTQQTSPSLNDSPVEDCYLPLSLSESQFSFGNAKDTSPTMSIENMLETMNKQFLTDVDLQDMDHIDFTGESTNPPSGVTEPREEIKKPERRKSLSEEKVMVLRNEYVFSSIDINALTAIIGADNSTAETSQRRSSFKREHSQIDAGKHQPTSYYQTVNHSPPKRVKVESSGNNNQVMSKDRSMGESEKSRIPAHAAYPVRQNNKTRVTAAVKHPHLKTNNAKKIIPSSDGKNTTYPAKIPPDVNRTRKSGGGSSERRDEPSEMLFESKRSRNQSPLSLPRISDSPTTKQKRHFGDEKRKQQTQAELNATFDRLLSQPAENPIFRKTKTADTERCYGSTYRKAKTPDGRLCRGNPGQSNQHINAFVHRPPGSSSVRIPNESNSTEQDDPKNYEWLKYIDPMIKHLPKSLHVKPLVTFDPVTSANDPKM